MKQKTQRISRQLKRNYDCWLDWQYYGQKFDGIKAVNTIRTLNHWRRSDLPSKRKLQECADYMRAYKVDEVNWDEVPFYVRPLTQKRITAHNAALDTIYYVNRPDAQLLNLMLDWDDKDKLHGDTAEAAQWLDQQHLHGQSFIQSSTSGTGTHQYLFVITDLSVEQQKPLYARLVKALRLEVAGAGFRCAHDLDQMKAVGCVMERSKKRGIQIATGGIFGKLPRLATPEAEAAWLQRKALPWSMLVDLVTKLEAKHSTGGLVAGYIDRVGTGTVNNPVDLPECAKPADSHKYSERLQLMLQDGNKQRVALAAVFQFELQHGKRPTEADFELLNTIYSATPTATGLPLTPKRIERFQMALKYSEGRQCLKRSLIAPAACQRLEAYFHDVDLEQINQKLMRAKQRKLSAADVARCWLYFHAAYNWVGKAKAGEVGRVPLTALMGLASEEQQAVKLSKNGVVACMKLFGAMGLVSITDPASHADNRCAKYSMLVDLLGGG